MASHSVLNLASFRTAFPAFSNITTFPDVMVNAYYANACEYMDSNDNWDGLNGSTLDFALQLVTCHLLQIGYNISNGLTINQPITNATQGRVKVAFVPPPAKTAWEYWLSSTPYGQQVWALLSVQAMGGWSVGGLPETNAFRKVGGLF